MPRRGSTAGRSTSTANARRYGATATVAGNVTLPDTAQDAAAQPIVFDLRGQARHVDLRKMPRDLKRAAGRRPTSTPTITRPDR